MVSGESAVGPIPIARSYFDATEQKLAAGIIASGWIAQGKAVAQFEAAVASYTGAAYAVAVSSGTAALHLALTVSGVGHGDEVIVPSFSFIATANAVLYCGARPVFIDIDPATYNIDPLQIIEFIEKRCRFDSKRRLVNRATRGRVRAIMPVHQFGLPCELDAIGRIAKKYGLALVEDAACALGSSYKGRRIGDGRNISCLSFHPRKIITTGEGGMVLTNDRRAAEKIRVLRNHGACLTAMDKHSGKKRCAEDYEVLGYNYRLTDLQAAVGIAQMARLPAIVGSRRRIAENYDKAFRDCAAIETPFIPAYAAPNYQSYVIRLSGRLASSRDAIVAKLAKAGISTRRGNTAIHTRTIHRKIGCDAALPKTEDAASGTIALPIYFGMTGREGSRVADALLSAVACHDK